MVWLRTMGCMGRLKSQIALNPSDMLATRDLARLYLERKRAKQKDEAGSREAIGQAKHTWGVLPSFMRRHAWPWFAAALFSPFWL